MVRLAEKAFAPGKVPFPLMHIDSKWKFKEMIEFRDSYAKKFGWNLIVESNMEAFHAGVGPFIEPSVLMCQFIDKWSNIHRKTFTSTQIGTLLVRHYHYDIRFICLRKQRQTYSLENDS